MRGAVTLRFAGAVFTALLLLSACVGGRVITTDLGYDPARKVSEPFAGAGTLKVALVPFEASAGVTDTLGKWVGFRGREDVLKASGPPAGAVTKAVFDYMKKAGLDVVMAP
ncbi:MAG TPA: hypothetical protein VNK06_04250, partial [Thermodesulfobacteriota bacterium]|nr:hypothetical protein [Thermodesulfobacteriota bacterium]